MIKKLTWTIGSHKSDRGDHLSMTAFGEYSCRGHDGRGWSLWFRERCLGDKPAGIREIKDLDVQKASAQKHFEAQVKTCLETRL